MVDQQQHRPLVLLITTVITMERRMDAVPLRVRSPLVFPLVIPFPLQHTLVLSHTRRERRVDQQSLDGIMIRPLAPVRHTHSMDVMETVTTSPLNKFVLLIR